MLRGWYRPLGVVLGGILCIQLSAFAAEKETKKSSEPAKKLLKYRQRKRPWYQKKKKLHRRNRRTIQRRFWLL